MHQSVAGGCRRTDRAFVYPLNALLPAFVCGLCTEQGTFHVGCQSFARSWKYGCHRKGYAKFLPETLSAEVARLKEDFASLEIV